MYKKSLDDVLDMWRGESERKLHSNIINQLLSEMDGVDAKNEGVFIQGATNQPWDVDAALRRLEHENNRIKVSDLEALRRFFASHIGREDFYDAILAIDEIHNYAKASVRELDILEVAPDPQGRA